MKGKDYVLLDFWGTWCLPCRELTPELKRISKDYVSNTNIVGIAYDKNIESVIKYTREQNINWANAFQKNNKRNDIERR